ncbi:hypothetical protein O181_107158 [Austropuccinia psidii MF-1]|uniref:Uncharacterized protein n=1 Tax=Austropuccinia psidii MF-1 TaxID=1389203 RepID=A0A9Q3JQA9_9BASI|nr:hypothetical protein [Austropuccinia psidii MF-1]
MRPHHPPDETPTLPPHLRPHHLYAHVVPSPHASAAAHHPHSCVVPSRHDSKTANNPYACVVPSRHASYTANHPYPYVVPSQHASDTIYHPYACVEPSQHGLPSLRLCSALPKWLQCFPHTGLILNLLLGPQDETMMPPPLLAILALPRRPQPSLCLCTPATYHPHNSVLHP